MRRSFPMRKVWLIICFVVLLVIQTSMIYQIYDIEAAIGANAYPADGQGEGEGFPDGKEDAGAVDMATLADIIEAQKLLVAEGAADAPDDTADAAGVMDGEALLSSLHKSDWSLILINKQHPIPEDYSFELGSIGSGMKCDKRILFMLRQMMEAADEDGVTLIVRSPYRNEQRQDYLFNQKIKSYMKSNMSYLESYRQAAQAVTLPGSSEHQAGLALDIISNRYSGLDEGFAKTDAGKWLEEHSYEYGFILRYPKGKEDVTGIEFEPWHFRYVGVAAASYIHENDLTLEEFVDLLGE